MPRSPPPRGSGLVRSALGAVLSLRAIAPLVTLEAISRRATGVAGGVRTVFLRSRLANAVRGDHAVPTRHLLLHARRRALPRSHGSPSDAGRGRGSRGRVRKNYWPLHVVAQDQRGADAFVRAGPLVRPLVQKADEGVGRRPGACPTPVWKSALVEQAFSLQRGLQSPPKPRSARTPARPWRSSAAGSPPCEYRKPQSENPAPAAAFRSAPGTPPAAPCRRSAPAEPDG